MSRPPQNFTFRNRKYNACEAFGYGPRGPCVFIRIEEWDYMLDAYPRLIKPDPEIPDFLRKAIELWFSLKLATTLQTYLEKTLSGDPLFSP